CRGADVDRGEFRRAIDEACVLNRAIALEQDRSILGFVLAAAAFFDEAAVHEDAADAVGDDRVLADPVEIAVVDELALGAFFAADADISRIGYVAIGEEGRPLVLMVLDPEAGARG